MISSSWFEFSMAGIGLTVPPVLLAVLVFITNQLKKLKKFGLKRMTEKVMFFAVLLFIHYHILCCNHTMIYIIIRSATSSVSSSTDTTGRLYLRTFGIVYIFLQSVYVRACRINPGVAKKGGSDPCKDFLVSQKPPSNLVIIMFLVSLMIMMLVLN